MKTVLWSNEYDYTKAIYEDLKIDNYDNTDDSGLWDLATEYTYDYLDDLIVQLNIDTEGEIITIADLGLWTGRVQGYRVSSNNLSSVIRGEHDTLKVGLNSYDFVGVERHHDGNNYYTYRMLKPDLSEAQIENFLELIYTETVTKQHISYYTKSLKTIVEKAVGIK